MFHSLGKNNKINRLHGRYLQILYNDKKLLEKDNSLSIHEGNLRFLAIEMFKFKRGLGRALCKEMIPQNRHDRYELRNNVDFTLP